ncbi:MAG: hypothetical protein ABSG32_03900 [Terriglobia bacterium]|jgi:hypothetical protein
MTHTAYATAKLTSPNGRKATGEMEGTNTTQAEATLSYEASDTGTYLEAGTHSVYCPCMGMFINNVGSQASVSNAYPVNFVQVGPGEDLGDADLHFNYSWQSSSGKLPDLSACVIYEVVTYGNGNSPFVWPSPPWNYSNLNPVVNGVPGTDDGFSDDQLDGDDSWTKPYKAVTFPATQYYRYTCNGGSEVNLMGPMSIVRTVSQNANSTFMYQVTKSGASATINPLP